MMVEFNLKVSDQQYRKLFRFFDSEDDGELSLHDLVHKLLGQLWVFLRDASGEIGVDHDLMRQVLYHSGQGLHQDLFGVYFVF